MYISDIVLVSPGWTTYLPQVNLTGRKPLAVIETSADTEWKVTPQMLEKSIESSSGKCSTHKNILLIFNNPGNPCKLSVLQ